MIRILIIILFFLFPFISKGQVYFYKKIENYDSLNTGIAINLTENKVWDDELFIIPIGFDFQIGSEMYDSVQVDTDGVFTFFQSCGLTSFPEGHILMSFFADMSDRGEYLGNGTTPLSPIQYLMEGDEGSRIFKIEWKNVSLYGGDGYDDFLNFQVWLYESGNILFEIRFGTSFITNPSDTDIWGWGPGPIVAFNFEEDCDINTPPLTHVVAGNPNNPDDTIVVGFIDFALAIYTIEHVPDSGMVYQFLKYPISALGYSIAENDLKIYPNPASEKLYVEAVSAKEKYRFIEIADISGRLMLRGELSFEYENNVEIDVTHLDEGIYIIRIVSETQSVFKKFVKLK